MKRRVAQQYARDNFDLSRVDPEDRTNVRAILVRTLLFHTPMPPLQCDIVPEGNHYHVTLRGWRKRIDDAAWYATFLHPEQRTPAALYSIASSTTTPVAADGETHKQLIVARGATPVATATRRGRRARAADGKTPLLPPPQAALGPSWDMAEVKRDDRDVVRNAMRTIAYFGGDDMMPLTAKTYPTTEGYNVVISGWNAPIDDGDWYESFLEPQKRDHCMVYVTVTETVPQPDDDLPPIKIVRIKPPDWGGDGGPAAVAKPKSLKQRRGRNRRHHKRRR